MTRETTGHRDEFGTLRGSYGQVIPEPRTPTCHTCGAAFKASREGRTVNCPSHRTSEARAAYARAAAASASTRPCGGCEGTGRVNGRPCHIAYCEGGLVRL